MTTPAAGLALAAPIPVEVHAEGSGFVLHRGGKPYVIKGAGGSEDLEALAARGANSIRTWGAEDLGPTLDEAHRLGLSVSIGIWLGHERHGFDYSDDDAVYEQIERARKAVLAYKDHPALLLWGVGNEMEGFADGDNAAIWLAVNHIAAMIKALDPNHPTMTVTAEVGGARVKNIHRLCPSIDIVGINSYGGVRSLPERYTSAGGKKPFIVTEFGPAGPWEVQKTAWGAPVEQTSVGKARVYEAAYRAINRAPKALGSYAFLWGHKREGTATWFGLRLPDGAPLSGADRLQFMWTGRYPKNRSPEISALVPKGAPIQDPGGVLEVEALVTDPERDQVTLTWVLEPEATKYLTGGDKQAEPETYPDALERLGKRKVRVKLPDRPGGYRLYAYARDGRGAATANLPLQVRGEVPPGNDPGKLPVAVVGTKRPRWIPSGYMGATKAIKMTPHAEDGRDGFLVQYTRPDNWGGVVWQHPANDWGDRPGGFDLTGAKKLTFWARGASGGEKVKFGYGLLKGDSAHPDSSGNETEKVLKNRWERYSLDLGGKDLSRIKSGFFWVVSGRGKPIEFYLADVRYE